MVFVDSGVVESPPRSQFAARGALFLHGRRSRRVVPRQAFHQSRRQSGRHDPRLRYILSLDRKRGRTVAECPLSYDGKTYSLDFGILDRELSHPLATLLVLCNPHNPTGNVWTKEELARIGEMCFERGVTVISDEVHCDLTDPGAVYVPFVSAGEACGKAGVSVLSAGKAFNIAGLQSAAVYAPDERLRNIAVRGLNSDELAEANTFAAIATAAAFSEGGEWLDELRAYLAENKRFAREYIEKNIRGLTVAGSRATYLMWIDVGGDNGRRRRVRGIPARKDGTVPVRRRAVPR